MRRGKSERGTLTTDGSMGSTLEACLCSAQAGYITGQNLLLDGGNYSGVL